MGLDVRVPAGLMFAIMGALLAVFGMAGDRSIYARALGININLTWGIVLMAAGGCLLALAARASKRERRDDRSRS